MQCVDEGQEGLFQNISTAIIFKAFCFPKIKQVVHGDDSNQLTHSLPVKNETLEFVRLVRSEHNISVVTRDRHLTRRHITAEWTFN